MLALGASDAIDAGTTSATTVNCTIMGVVTDTSAPPVAQVFDVIYQGQLANTVTQLYANSASQNALISAIHLFNTAASIQTVTLAVNGTAGSNSIATIVIPANGWANYEDGHGWEIRTSLGVPVSSPNFNSIGLGTPAAATTSLTAGAEVVQGGTLCALATGSLVVGNRFRFTINLVRTAAGTATWTVKVKWGTAGAVADAAIATWTSGTNTAAIDQAQLVIEVTILTLGAAATAACTAYYVNRLTEATGFGNLSPVPGSTATFDSTLTLPFLHVDITQGASAVVTGVGMAEQIK